MLKYFYEKTLNRENFVQDWIFFCLLQSLLTPQLPTLVDLVKILARNLMVLFSIWADLKDEAGNL